MNLNWKLLLLFILALVLRLALSASTIHGDLVMQANWGDWIYHHGWFGFYENSQWIYCWPNHPPFISLIYGLGFKLHEWLNTAFVGIGYFIAINHLGASKIGWFYHFVSWFGTAKYSDTPYLWGELISLKLIVILADLILAGMIYRIIKKKAPKLALWLTALYLFSPFSWFESAVWGQNDQLALIFLLLAFRFLSKDKLAWLSASLLLISAGLKPTSLIFGPIFFWFALKNKKRFWLTAGGGLLALAWYFIFVKLSSPNDFISFNINLSRKLFIKGELWTWVNTFNFWRIVSAYLTNYNNRFLGLSLQIWGYLLFAIVNIWAAFKFRQRDWNSSLNAVFVVAFAGWLFMTAMHERYLFTAVALGVILLAQNIKMLMYWLGLSLIFWVNMYNGWWWPDSFGWLKNILTWGDFMDGVVPKLLSVINLFIFYRMLKGLKRPVNLMYKNYKRRLLY